MDGCSFRDENTFGKADEALIDKGSKPPKNKYLSMKSKPIFSVDLLQWLNLDKPEIYEQSKLPKEAMSEMSLKSSGISFLGCQRNI